MDYDNIKKLIDYMGGSNLSTLDVEFPDGTKISMKKGNNECSQVNNSQNAIVKPQENDVITESKIEESKKNNQDEQEYKYIKSPMVGTFYSKPSPNENSFVEIGQSIKKGCTTCIIEAMKLLNEIEAEFDGVVVEILKNDGDPVEYGENLIKLK